MVLSVLVQFGLHQVKPSKAVEYLGFIIDSEKQSFLIPRRKIESFASLRETILAYKSQIPLRTMQPFQGKCISLLLAVPAAKFFIRGTSKAIASAEVRGHVTLNEFQREEVTYWRFLDDWQQSFPWREERHYRISLSTDASNYGWGCVIHQMSGDLEMGDYWTDDRPSKEKLALVHAIRALPDDIRDARVDACVDSKVMIGAWES